MHETIQTWLISRTNQIPISEESLKEAFRLNLFAEFQQAKTTKLLCDKATLKEYYKDGCAILGHLHRNADHYFPSEQRELLGVELPLDVPLTEHIKFLAYLDIVTKDTETNRIFIYDLKTSKAGWNYEKRDPRKVNQLLLYKSFYSEQFGVPSKDITVEFVILKRKTAQMRVEKFRPQVSAQQARRLFDGFVSETFDSSGIARLDNLPPTPSKHACRFCPFNQRPDLCSSSYYLPSSQNTVLPLSSVS